MYRFAKETLLGLLLGIIAGITLSLLLTAAAYQSRPSYDLVIGGLLDEPHLRDFNVREVTQGDAPTPFRWTESRSQIIFRDIGQQDLDVTLTASGSRPAGVPTSTLHVSVGEQTLLRAVPSPDIQSYTFPVGRELLPGGTLTLTLETTAFTPEGDPRSLGLPIFRVQAVPGAAPDLFITPPWTVLLAVALSSTLIALMLALLGFGPWLVGLGGTVPGVLAGLFLVTDRLWLTGGEWTASWPAAILASGVIAGLAWGVLYWLKRAASLPVTPKHLRIAAAFIFAACLVRLAGQLHPQIFIVDLFFHRNRFDQVLAGDLLFKIRSAEWGGRETFYLPTSYVLMTPLQWLLSDKLMVIRIFTVAVGTLGALPIFAVASRVWNARAGLLASLLYLILPISVLPFSWGITTNIFGEFSLLCALSVAVLAYPRLEIRRPAFWLFLLFLLFALLSHPGVVQLSAVSMGPLALLWLASGRRNGAWKAGAWLMLAVALAGGLSYLLYYRHFLGDMLSTLGDIGRERGADPRPGIGVRVGGSVSDKGLGLILRYAESRWDWLWGGLYGFWAEARAYYRVWPIGAALLGFVGLWLSVRRSLSVGSRKGLLWASAAWGLTGLLFALVGWTLNLYVRYSLFLLPMVALGAGAFLAALWGKGRMGRAAVILLLVFFTVEALALWQYRISYALK